MGEASEKPKSREIRKVRFSFLCLTFVAYLAIGGAVFQVIEGPVEEREKEILLEIRNTFLRNNSDCITGMLKAYLLFFSYKT